MFGLPPLPRTLAASERDVGSARAEVRLSAIPELVRHARTDAAVREKAVPLLVARLSDESPRVRAAAAVGLGDLAAEEVVTSILVAVDDDDAHVRQMAINALGEIGDARALPRLRRALGDGRPEVRYQSLIALSRVAKDEAEIEEALVTATRDTDEAIAHIALRIAEERVDAGKTLSEPLLVRARALMKGESKNLALVAAIVLAKAGETDAHPRILDVVRHDGRGPRPDKEDESAAVELAGALGLREAVPFLERRAFGLRRWFSDTCSFHARIALARMGHARAIAEILKDLDATKREVLGAAIASAGRARLAAARPAIARLSTAAADPELVREALDLIDRDARGAEAPSS